VNRLISLISTGIRFAALYVAFVSVQLLNHAQAQSLDSVLQLNSITISADRLHSYTKGLNVISIDSITLDRYSTGDAATLLSTQTPVYIKTYGQGGLASLSIRGTLATHSGVYWNGININQPNLGMTDLSLVPMYFFESVALQYGGSGALFGSGNIGGGLHLGNLAHFSTPLNVKLTTGLGSFNEYLCNAKVGFGDKKISYAGGFALKKNENNFPYTNDSLQKVRQENASFNNGSFMQQIDYRTGTNSLLITGLWIQHSDRELPAAMNTSGSKQHQQDISYRTFLKWELFHSNKLLILRSAWLVDKMNYTNAMISLDAHYLTRTALLESEYYWNASDKTRIGIAANSSAFMALIESYNGNRRQMKGSVLVSLQQMLPFKDWILTANLRKEWIEGYKVPLSPSLGAEGMLSRHIKAKLNLSGNFRAPTLNDRYWQPGGNPELKPETSWNSEAGMTWSGTGPGKSSKTDFSVTAYLSVVSDLILWTPVPGSGIWSPENIQKIYSRGIELNGHSSFAIGKVTAVFHAAYSYTPSTFAKTDTSISSTEGKQLTYIPLHNAVAGFRLVHSHFFVEWEQTLTGKRYTLKDNSEFLEGYYLSNLTTGSSVSVFKSRFRIQLVIRNLFDTDYQAIQNYAVPGRNFLLTINLAI
jgi:vitamin B12 transporter